MITIDQEALCSFCERNPDNCEGSICKETRESYIDDNGLIESDADSFRDLNLGDPVYRIKDQRLLIAKVTAVHNSENAGFKVCTESIDFKVDPALTMNHSKNFFTSKDEAMVEFSRQITETMKAMMKSQLQFEREAK